MAAPSSAITKVAAAAAAVGRAIEHQGGHASAAAAVGYNAHVHGGGAHWAEHRHYDSIEPPAPRSFRVFADQPRPSSAVVTPAAPQSAATHGQQPVSTLNVEELQRMYPPSGRIFSDQVNHYGVGQTAGRIFNDQPQH